MEKKDFQNAIEQIHKDSKERKFKQSYDLIINLKNLDMKKPDQQVDLFIKLPHSMGKKNKVCALVGGELADQAKTACDNAIVAADFPKFTDKKEIKKLSKDYDFFIAQANIMTDVAKHFGRTLGPKGKMPNPKAGCVVPPNFPNLKGLAEKLGNTVKCQAKIQPSIKVLIGKEGMEQEQVAENAATIYTQVLKKLPGETNNIKNVMLKLSMGKPVKVGEKKAEVKNE